MINYGKVMDAIVRVGNKVLNDSFKAIINLMLPDSIKVSFAVYKHIPIERLELIEKISNCENESKRKKLIEKSKLNKYEEILASTKNISLF